MPSRRVNTAAAARAKKACWWAFPVAPRWLPSRRNCPRFLPAAPCWASITTQASATCRWKVICQPDLRPACCGLLQQEVAVARVQGVCCRRGFVLQVHPGELALACLGEQVVQFVGGIRIRQPRGPHVGNAVAAYK